jgi:hypothetical protein
VATPAPAGDESGSILLRSSAASPAFAAVTSIPVTLRSLIPAPDPSSTVTGTLTVGKPVTALVTVTNSTTTPEAYFVDARLNRPATIDLATTTPRLTLPNNMGVEPEFLVPSHTTALHTAVSSPDPVYFDFSWTFGSPDIGSTTGKTATGAYSATEVPDGYWGVTPSLLGPFGANSPQNVVGAVSMTATTAAFDPAVTAGTGDLWLGSTNPAATFAPYVARSGQSVIIPVTIDPEGKAGTVVSGTLYVVDSSLFSTTALGEPGGLPFGSDVAAFPYSYTIGA